MNRSICRFLLLATVSSFSVQVLFAQCNGVYSVSYDASAAQATYTFGASGSCGVANVNVWGPWWMPGYVVDFNDKTPSVSATEVHDTACLADGTYTLLTESSCGVGPVDQCAGEREPLAQRAPITINNMPSVGVSAGPQGTSTLYDVTMTYSFPNTSSSDGRQRFLSLTEIDPLGRSSIVWDSTNTPLTQQSGSVTFTIDTSCWLEGTHQLEPTARHSCANSTKEGSPQTITIQRQPSLSAAVTKNAAGGHHIAISYQFFDSGASRTVTLTILPTATDSGGEVNRYTSLPMQGTIDTDVTVESRRLLRITALNGNCYSTDKTVALSPSCCAAGGGPPAWGGDPVRLWDGTVTYSERDPLPDDLGMVFRRTYMSYAQRSRAFGLGWFSAFDGSVAVADTAQHKSIVVYTESDDRVLFDQLPNGAWLQSWPAGSTLRGTLSGSEAAGYSYREAGASIVRLYGGSGSHRLIGVKDTRSGRQVTIGYDTAGDPTSVSDGFGAWACTATADANHRITQISVNGRPDLVWNYGYDAAGNLTSVTLTGTATPWRTYGYVQAGSGWYLASIADALGSMLEQHSYDASGRATSSLGPSGDITNIQYSQTNPSTTIVTRADNSTATYTQTFADRDVTSQLTGGCGACGGHDLTAAYDALGHTWRVQDGRGYIIESLYDQNPYGPRNVISETRALRPSGCDPAADPAHCALTPAALAAATLTSTAASQTTSYAYGDMNWPDRPTEIDRESVMVPGQRFAESFTYDPATGQALTHTLAGATGADAHQESHMTATALYNGAEGAAFDPGGTFQAAWVTAAQPSGMVKSVTGPRTDVATTTLYVYYPIGSTAPAASQGRLAAVRNAVGQVTRFADYDVFGHAATITDANGVVTTLTFDALGRLLTSTVRGVAGCETAADPLCATDLTSTNGYANVTGPLSVTQRPSNDASRYPAVAYTYDSRGRVAAIMRGFLRTDISGCTPPCIDRSEQIVYTYDSATQKKASESYQAWVNGAWSETTRESFSYDSFGRLARTTHADNSSIVYGYDGSDDLVSVQDERHTSANTIYTFDGAKRLTTVTQTLGNGNVSTSYGYDVRDNLVAVTDPNGNTTAYAYDDFGRLLRQTSPVTGVTAYAYDPDGNVLTSVDANAMTTARTYDALGRVTQAASPGETVTWRYDGADNGGAPFSSGRMTSMTDPAGKSVYKYDRRGLLVSEARTDETQTTVTTSYQYDADGNRAAMTYPSALSLQYTFDYAHRPASVSVGSSAIVSAASYLPFGPLTTMTFGNGTRRTVTFDTRYRVTENKLVSGGGAAMADTLYAEDGAGNITQIHDALDPGFNRDFAYDDLNRLVTANTGASLWGNGSYTYDKMGNMLTLDLGGMIEVDPNQPLRCKTCRTQPQAMPAPGSRHEIYAYQGTTPLLDHVTSGGIDKPVSYDAAGNEMEYFADRAYSGRNLLATVTDNSGDSTPAHQIAYAYDGRGVRVTRTESPVPSGSATRRYYYSPELRLLTMTTDDQQNVWGSGRLRPTTVASSRYDIVWFDGVPVAQLTGGTTWTGTFTDHLGTPILQFDASSTITWRAEYEAYGDLWQLRAGDSRYDQPLRFPGQEAAMTWEGHEENYNVFRWYASGRGRYTQSDPIGVGGAGHFDTDRLRRWSLSLDPRSVAEDIQSSVPLYSYAGGNPITAIDSLGLAKIHCYVSLLWQGKGKCIYGGFCYDLFTNQPYIALGGVHVASCVKCSARCDYYSHSWTISAPEDWHCIPPMHIYAVNPNPPIGDW